MSKTRGVRLQSPDRLRRAIRTCQQQQIKLRERELFLKQQLRIAQRRLDLCHELRDQGIEYKYIARRIRRSPQFVYQLLHPEQRRRRDVQRRSDE